MSKRQMQKMLRLMASGEPVELTSPMASVKKLARLAFVAQQFGYEYIDVRQSGGRNSALIMLIVPDPSPQARARAAQNWAQYPNAADGVSVPPLVPDAFELLKARINFDLTGKNAEKRMGYGGHRRHHRLCGPRVRLGADAAALVVAACPLAGRSSWRSSASASSSPASATPSSRPGSRPPGSCRCTDETGRVRYLPPGAQMPGQIPGQQNPFAAGPYGNQRPGRPRSGYGAAGPRPAGARPVRRPGSGPVRQPARPGPAAPTALPRPRRPVRRPAAATAALRPAPAAVRATAAAATAAAARPAAALPPAEPHWQPPQPPQPDAPWADAPI